MLGPLSGALSQWYPRAVSRPRLATRGCWALVLWLSACVAEYQAIPEQGDSSSGEGATDDPTDTDPDETSGVPECGEDRAECSGECVDLQWDDEYCGECDVACETGTTCVEGLCRASCDSGCVPDLSYCDDGFCTCRPETINCNGTCVDPRNDPDHCGDCWDECPPSAPLCGDGECIPDCDDFPDTCSDSCTHLEFDPLSCGSCGFLCGVAETCVDSECVGYAQLDPLACSECPCPGLCDGPCCFSEILDANICVDALDCPGE